LPDKQETVTFYTEEEKRKKKKKSGQAKNKQCYAAHICYTYNVNK
jgi:hypothetical protein